MNDSISDLVKISIRATQLESGRSEDILLYPGIALPYVTPTWITNLHYFPSFERVYTTAPARLAPRVTMYVGLPLGEFSCYLKTQT